MADRRRARRGYRRVVGVGMAVLDHLYRVDELALGAVRTRYRDRLVSSGGMAANAVAQAAAMGVEAHLLTLLGDDDDGRRVARDLRALGVRTRRIVRDPRRPTSVAVVLVDRRTGERRFVIPDRRRLERAAPDFDLSPLDARSVLLLDGHFPAQALRAARRARALGAAVVADFSRPRPDFLRLLPWVDHPILPLEFVERWDEPEPRRALFALRERYGGTPVVTLGRRGALALVDGRVRRIPARRVRVRDTTGAGDVFHGAFAAALCLGLEPLPALELATAEAARCCAALGGLGHLRPPAFASRSSRARAPAPGGSRGSAVRRPGAS